jgi:hypothetical protein
MPHLPECECNECNKEEQNQSLDEFEIRYAGFPEEL